MENYPDDNPTKEKIERLVNLFVDRHILMPAIDDFDTPQYIIVPRSEALAIGIKPNGVVTDEVDMDDYDDLMSRSVDPVYN